MRKLLNPSAAGLAAALTRPYAGNIEIDMIVREILASVKSGGDDAVRAYSVKFDGYTSASLRVEASEIDQAESESARLLKRPFS